MMGSRVNDKILGIISDESGSTCPLAALKIIKSFLQNCKF